MQSSIIWFSRMPHTCPIEGCHLVLKWTTSIKKCGALESRCKCGARIQETGTDGFIITNIPRGKKVNGSQSCKNLHRSYYEKVSPVHSGASRAWIRGPNSPNKHAK